PTFYRIIKKKSVEEFKPDPYIATVLNCAFWVFYGLPFVHPHSFLVVTINGVGLVFEFVYLTIFYIYATNKGRRKVLLLLGLEALFFVAVALITFIKFIYMYLFFLYSITVFIHLSIHKSLLCYLKLTLVSAKVIKTKSVEYMPFWLSLTNFLNGVCWTIYALIHPFDIYVLVSNGIGALSGLIQLILYACYCSCNNGEKNGGDGDNTVSTTVAKGNIEL
ncbi:hypothetical protein S245_072063, partial [Arachis hypogaea]